MPDPVHIDADPDMNSAPPPPYPGVGSGVGVGGFHMPPIPQSQNRPRLPVDRRNPRLESLPEDTRLVKFQTIVRDGKEIIIGRIKVPTPGSSQHAFILRRYDTNAISLTTMYKVAFPGASEQDEKREMEWVRSTYDTRNTNGGRDCGFPDGVRLAGQWVSRDLAIHLAPAYGLHDLIVALSRSEPDPNISYRKSQRSQQASEEIARQRSERGAAAASSNTAAASGSRAVPAIAVTEASGSTPKRARRAGAEADGETTPRRVTVEATTTVTAPMGSLDINAEIEQAKQLVRDLKRELQLRAAAGDEIEEMGGEASGSGERGVKRAMAEEGTVISSGSSRAERVIRTNKRVKQQNTGAQTAKRAAFGAALFSLGVGAAMFFPTIAEMASQYL